MLRNRFILMTESSGSRHPLEGARVILSPPHAPFPVAIPLLDGTCGHSLISHSTCRSNASGHGFEKG